MKVTKPAEKMGKLKKLLEDASTRKYGDVAKSHGYQYIGMMYFEMRGVSYRSYGYEFHGEGQRDPMYFQVFSVEKNGTKTYHFEFSTQDGGKATYESPDMKKEQVADALEKKLQELNG